MPGLTHEQVEKLERSRWAALMGADLDELDRLYCDDLVYTHSNGQRDTKESFLMLLRSGTLRYLRLEPTDERILLVGDVAVVSGDVMIEALAGSSVYESAVSYTAVWAQQDDRFVHIAWHSSPKNG